MTDDAATRGHIDRLCEVLARVTEVEVTPRSFKAPYALAAAFAEGDVQLAWVSPTLFTTHPAFANAVPLVSSVREGRAAYHVVLFTSERSGIHSVDDLEGRRAAWVAESSASGYIIPRLALARLGYDPRTMFESETFFGSHGDMARAVLKGQADVGATFAVFEGGDRRRPIARAGFMGVVSHRVGRILHAAGSIPADMMVVSDSTPQPLRERLTRAFEAMSGDDDARETIRAVFGADGYERFDPSAMRWLAEAMARGRELGLLPAQPVDGRSVHPR